MELKLQGNDMSAMYDLYEALDAEMAQAGLTSDFSVSEPAEPLDEVTYRGDIGTWVTVAIAAVGAGGAVTVLISSIASVVAKHIESQKLELVIEKDGQKIDLKGPAKEIQATLEKIYS